MFAANCMRKEPTSRYQIGPTISGPWQVLDLTTGIAARMGVLVLNSMSKDQAIALRELLNEQHDDAQAMA